MLFPTGVLSFLGLSPVGADEELGVEVLDSLNMRVQRINELVVDPNALESFEEAVQELLLELSDDGVAERFAAAVAPPSLRTYVLNAFQMAVAFRVVTFSELREQQLQRDALLAALSDADGELLCEDPLCPVHSNLN